MATLKEYSEARHQVAFADQLVVTKADKAGEARMPRIVDSLRELNPHVPVRPWHPGIPPESLFNGTGEQAAVLLERPEAWLGNLLNARRVQGEKAGGSRSLFEAGPGPDQIGRAPV